MSNNEKKELLKEAIIKILSGIMLLGALLFIPAGDLHWRNGWLLMAILFVPMFAAGIIMLIKAPGLLKSRLRAKESQGEQKEVIALSGLMFIAAFVLAGLTYRFRWMQLPETVIWAAVVVFLLAYCLFGEVLRENRYLSRVIEVQEDQTVVDT